MHLWNNSVLGVAPPVIPSFLVSYLVIIWAAGFLRPLFAFILNLNFSGVGSTEFG